MRVCIVRKRRMVALVLLLSVLTMLFALNYSDGVNEAIAASKKVPIYKVQTEEQLAAISFDAAWGSDKTKMILDILDRNNVKATFFMVGFWVDKYPELVKEIHDRGHLLGNHSTNHLHMNELSEKEMREEITVTSEKINQLVGYTPKVFRAPFGEYNNKLLEVLEDLGMQAIQWDVDSLDWKGISGGEISENILKKIKVGSIILCHNNSNHIVEALPILLLGIKNKGIELVRMDRLVYSENYTIDNNGVQKRINIQ